MESSCIFCKIVGKEIPASVVYEDSKVLAFLDISPANKGHVLVIPKQHYVTLLEVPDSTLAEVAKVVKKVSAAVLKATKAKNFNFVQSNGPVAGQVVMHVHFHIFPRFKNDGLLAGRLNRPALVYEEGEMKEYMKRIREAMQ
ncbi:MAG TPA: HIT family protein [Nanoarchaeota archaeon]|nr:MAG: Hit-like protein involved in cell-cycle regulation [archaeon GW2011_AR6]MBS3082602.1 HIT family protein [Candidatus Pacearchaeota archaeon]HIH17437.1 HIT family protein [Nanoarchaeota archaeon]HIH33980.1 HIT family protein [Nanoarchaeota archaeon]HIH51730.1 HIT family protein [Nanoarchaeota archaeon]